MTFRVATVATAFFVAAYAVANYANAQSLLPYQSTRCFALPSDASVGAIPSQEQMDAAWGVDTIDYAVGLEYLSISASEHPELGLHQTLIPQDHGSTRSIVQWSLKPAKTYQLSQKVFLPEGFDWGGRNEGGKLGFGLGGGSVTAGGDIRNDGFTSRFMWRGNNDGTASVVIYSYASDRTQNLPYGDDYKLEDSQIPTGEWFELAMEVTTNSSARASDGSVRAWFNGKLALKKDGIRWQSEGSNIVVDALSYTTFHGGNDPSWSPENDTFIEFADICWSTPITKQRI